MKLLFWYLTQVTTIALEYAKYIYFGLLKVKSCIKMKELAYINQKKPI